MDDESPKVSIIVPSLNTRDLLGRCIASLTRQTASSRCEVIVVDMSSTDGTPDTVQARFPAARVLRDVLGLAEPQTYARALGSALHG